MKKFIGYLMGQVKCWSAWDFGVFKVALVSAGILLGAYFAAFFMQYIGIVWAISAIAYILTMYAVFRKR